MYKFLLTFFVAAALLQIGWCCTCKITSYYMKYCRADFAVIGKLEDNHCTGTEHLKYYIMCPAERVYRVKVTEVLKKPESSTLKVGDEMEIFTPGSGDICGKFVDRTSSDVLFAGAYDSEFFDIDLCHSIATPFIESKRDLLVPQDKKCEKLLKRYHHKMRKISK